VNVAHTAQIRNKHKTLISKLDGKLLLAVLRIAEKAILNYIIKEQDINGIHLVLDIQQ
jgi:hypothetical protein